MNKQQTQVVRIEQITSRNPFTDQDETVDQEVRKCITCGKEFHTPAGSSNVSAGSLYCREHYAEYRNDSEARMNSTNWNDFADEMADGAPPQKDKRR